MRILGLAVVALLVVSLVGRTEANRRAKRVVGYLTAVALGLGLGVLVGFISLIAGLCNNAMAGPDGCTDEELERQKLLMAGALVVPFLVVGAYAAVDVTVERRRPRDGE